MFDADDDAPAPLPDTSDLRVLAICVTSDGSRWLPRVLDALAAQTRPVDDLVTVDAGSTDDSPDLARAHPAVDRVVDASPTGFGAAVASALASPGASEGHDAPDWYWLLHDDSAPDADALAQLLAEAIRTPEAAVVGPKLREWPSLKRLQEVGVTLSGTGTVWTGLEPGEPDQGQHDQPRDVLAVSSAGMLVRRDVWDEVGGFDPAIPFVGDDIDFGWRVNRAGHKVRVAPAAVVFHVEALTRGLREHTGLRPRRLRREASLRTLVANASVPGAWWQYVRLLLGSMLRALALVLAKAPREALDEVQGTVAFYARPSSLWRARRNRARTASVPARQVRHLLPSPWLPYRHGADVVLELARAYLAPSRPELTGRRAAAVDTGPVAEESESLPSERNPLEALRRRPLLAAFLLMTVVTLVASRSVLGGGPLEGGALFPAPDSVADWWRGYTASWHQVGLGGDDAFGPYVLALLVGGVASFGQPWLVVDVLLLGGPALAVLTAHRLGRAVLSSSRVRLWWALTYGLAVVATGAVAQGRIGTVVGAVVAPLVARAAIGVLDRDPRASWWQPGVRLGLALTVLTAFVPVAYPLAAAAVVVALLLRRFRSWSGVLVGLAVPWLLLGPWMWDRVLSPSFVWWEAGRLDAEVGTLDPDPLDLLLGNPGGEGGLPIWFGAGLVLVGLVGWLRSERRAAVTAAWGVGLLGLVAAAAAAGQRIEAYPGAPAVSVWVGFPLLVWVVALAFAGAVAADGAGDQLVARAFGWRQAVLALTAVVALLAPVFWGAAWLVRGSDDPLRRDGATPVPSYLTARAESPEGPAVLLLGTDPAADATTYTVLRGSGPRLGDEVVQPTRTDAAGFTEMVTRLVSNPDSGTLAELADRGIGSVVLTEGGDPGVAATLDRAPGLQATGTTEADVRAWSVTVRTGYARVVPGPLAPPDAATALPAGAEVPFDVAVGDQPAGSLLVLSARSGEHWRASQGGEALAPTPVSHGRQAFELTGPGPVQVDFESDRSRWVLGQVAGLALIVVLAAPGRRRPR